MPQSRRMRYQEYGLNAEQTELLVASREFADFYDEAVKVYPAYGAVANWMTGELNRNLNAKGKAVGELLVMPGTLAELVKMSEEGIVTKNAAKDILRVMCDTGESPMDIARRQGLLIQNDPTEIRALIRVVLDQQPKAVEEYRAGNPKIIGFLMGQVMRAGGNGIDPAICRQCLLELLKNS